VSDNIFKAAPETTVFKSPVDQAVEELTTIFHNNTPSDPTEPDWQDRLLHAKSEREKWDIRNAREAWQAENHRKFNQQRQDDHDRQIDELLKTPAHKRNKEFYDSLKAKGSVFYDPRIQRQMRSDKSTLKLGFYLKSKG
jgi:hypothetical protein